MSTEVVILKHVPQLEDATAVTHQALHERDGTAHRRDLAEHCILHLDALGEVLFDSDLVQEARELREEVAGCFVLHWEC